MSPQGEAPRGVARFLSAASFAVPTPPAAIPSNFVCPEDVERWNHRTRMRPELGAVRNPPLYCDAPPLFDVLEEYNCRLSCELQDRVKSYIIAYLPRDDDVSAKAAALRLANVFKTASKRRAKAEFFSALGFHGDVPKIKVSKLLPKRDDDFEPRPTLVAGSAPVPAYSYASLVDAVRPPSRKRKIIEVAPPDASASGETRASSPRAESEEQRYDNCQEYFGFDHMQMDVDLRVLVGESVTLDGFSYTVLRRAPDAADSIQFVESRTEEAIVAVSLDGLEPGDVVSVFSPNERLVASTFAQRKQRATRMADPRYYLRARDQVASHLNGQPPNLAPSFRPEIRVFRQRASEFVIPHTLLAFGRVKVDPAKLLQIVESLGGYDMCNTCDHWRKVSSDIGAKFDQHSHRAIRQAFELYFHTIIPSNRRKQRRS